jgi:plasmid stabilization system protein ParE
MNRALVVTPEAAADIQAAFAWYEEQRLGLGFEFNACVDAAMNAALRHPEAHLCVEDEVRRVLVRRFPYGVFYIIDDQAITVLAVMHSRRKPTAWKRQSRE